MSTSAQPLISPSVRRQTIADALRRTALRLPQKLGIVCGQTAWTYAEFDALATRLAAGLAGVGVKPGDRVAVLARNSHGFAALRFALARMGAVMVPINFMLKADEVAYILRHAGAETLATDSGLAELAKQASKLETQVKQFVWLPSEDISEPVPGMHNFHELAACTYALPESGFGQPRLGPNCLHQWHGVYAQRRHVDARCGALAVCELCCQCRNCRA
jgi:fatty-acyl-CoA synthase